MQNSTTTIIVASLNPAKIEAVRKTAAQLIGGGIDVRGVESVSGVSETPIDDDEAIKGCRNRIAFVRKTNPGADLYIAIEGLVGFSRHGAFVYSWALAEKGSNPRQFLGCSAKVQIPAELAEIVEAGAKLSDITKRVSGADADVSILGTNGVLTGGAFSRSDEFESALRCVIGLLISNKPLDHLMDSAVSADPTAAMTGIRERMNGLREEALSMARNAIRSRIEELEANFPGHEFTYERGMYSPCVKVDPPLHGASEIRAGEIGKNIGGRLSLVSDLPEMVALRSHLIAMNDIADILEDDFGLSIGTVRGRPAAHT